MAEIYSKEKGGARKSIEDLRKTIKKSGADHGFTSFATFPTKICFETQGDDEEVILFLRQHPIVNLPWIAMVFFAVLIPSLFVLFPPYMALPPSFQFVIVLMWYLFTAGFALAKFMSWFFNIYIVTDERIVDVDFENLFHREIATAKIDEIQDVSVQSSGAFETFFGYGDIYIQTAAEVTRFEFVAVPRPDQVGKILNQMIDMEEQEKIEGRVK